MHRSLALLILREFYPYLLDNQQVIPMQYLRINSGLIINLLNCMSCTCTKAPPVENSIFINGDFNQLYQCYSCTCPFKVPLNRGFLHPIGHVDLLDFEYSSEQVLSVHAQLANFQCSSSNVFINELLSTELDYIRDLFSIEVFHAILGQNSLFEIHDYRMLRIIHVYMYLLVFKRLNNNPSPEQHMADIFQNFFHLTDPFYTHIAQQLPFNKQKYDALKINNPLLVQQCEKHDLSRRLELQSWLNRCTTRLARYSLLMGTIVKKVFHNPLPIALFNNCTICSEPNYHCHVSSSFDQQLESHHYSKCMNIIKDIMFKVNQLSGQSENRVQLQYYNDHILTSFKTFNLKLNSTNQLLIRQGPLKRKEEGGSVDVHVLLLSNCFVMLRKKKQKFKISGWPLLLPLLQINPNLSLSSIVGASRWLNIARRNMDDNKGIVKKYNSLINKKSFKRSASSIRNSSSSMDMLFSRNSSKEELQTFENEPQLDKEQPVEPLEIKEPPEPIAPLDDLLIKKVNDFIIGDDDFIMRNDEPKEPKPVQISISESETSLITSKETLAQPEPIVDQFEFTISYLGHHSSNITFITSSIADKKAWLDAIQQQQIQMKREMNCVVAVTKLHLTNSLTHGNIGSGIISAFMFQDCLLMGCNDGIYIGYFHKRAKSEPLLHLATSSTNTLDTPSGMTNLINCKNTDSLVVKHVLSCDQVVQLEIIATQLIFMVDKTVYSIGIQELPLKESTANENPEFVLFLSNCKKLSAHVSFFKTGTSGNRPLVCVVKSTSLSSTIKAYEPTELNNSKGIHKYFSKPDSVKLYRELYIPSESTSLHFLKTKLCVGCTRGFEIVDLESLLTQGLLDPEDEDLGFAIKVDHLQPIALYRAYGYFLLCYNGIFNFNLEFAFYVDKSGKRAKKDFIIYWEGRPKQFAFHMPYILAFDADFIEVRDVEHGGLEEIIIGQEIVCLDNNPDNMIIKTTSENETQRIYLLNIRSA